MTSVYLPTPVFKIVMDFVGDITKEQQKIRKQKLLHNLRDRWILVFSFRTDEGWRRYYERVDNANSWRCMLVRYSNAWAWREEEDESETEEEKKANREVLRLFDTEGKAYIRSGYY